MEAPLFSGMTFPEMYERVLVDPLFRPWAELLLDEVGLAVGERVLDVACGTGIVARLAQQRVGRTGTVVGVDLSAPMIALARKVAPGIDWREGDATALPLPDGERFDVVVCQQGLQFVPDKAAAADQMRRALAAGGRVAVSTWRPDEQFPVLRELRRIAERHIGAIADKRHGFGEAGPLERLLRDAGFRDVRSKVSARTVRFTDAAAFVRLNAMALVGMSAASRSLRDDEREQTVAAIAADSAGLVRAQNDGTGLAYDIAAVVATGRA
jgi:ubiquinone/menaquinone biosynthesis C-methylase UbiE